MAWTASNTGAEFAAGHTPLANASRSNENSLTLADAANGADQGLDATSGRWSSMTPRGVLQTALSGSEDTSWQDMQRTVGTYQPGQMPALQDRLSDGSDEIT